MEGYLNIMAVIQKFFDQAISTNTSYNPQHYEGGEVPASSNVPTTGASASSFTQQSNNTNETNLTGVNVPTENTTKVVVLESDITKIQNHI